MLQPGTERKTAVLALLLSRRVPQLVELIR